jgi:hypothetical protein
MGRFLVITKSGDGKRGTRKRTIDNKVHLGPVTLIFVTIVLILIFSMLYVGIATFGSTAGYEYNELEQLLTELKDENKKLQLEATELQSIQHLRSSAEELKLRDATTYTFIEGEQGSVAQR